MLKYFNWSLGMPTACNFAGKSKTMVSIMASKPFDIRWTRTGLASYQRQFSTNIGEKKVIKLKRISLS